jgi:hypothetical protein
LDKQSTVELQALPRGVAVGLDGVAVGGRPAASEFVHVIETDKMVTIRIGAEILSPARSPDKIFFLDVFEGNICRSFHIELNHWKRKISNPGDFS